MGPAPARSGAGTRVQAVPHRLSRLAARDRRLEAGALFLLRRFEWDPAVRGLVPHRLCAARRPAIAEARMTRKTRPYLFYDTTSSVCDDCMRPVEAKIVFKDRS